MAKDNKVLWIVGLVVVGLILLHNYNPEIFAVAGSSAGTYQTTKTCSQFMKDIGNPSMSKPFSWAYTSTQYKCIKSYTTITNPRVGATTTYGCKLTYSANICPSSLIPISEYKVSDKCTRIYGDGNANNRNIIIIENNENKYLENYRQEVVQSIKNYYPFNLYKDKFNIYVFNDSKSPYVLPFYVSGSGYVSCGPNCFSQSVEAAVKDEYAQKCGVSTYKDAVFIPTSNVTGWAIETLDWNSETDGGIFKSTIIYYNYMIGLHSSHIIELCSGQYCIPGGSIFTHELMHEGGAIGESYGENPQMWTNASVQNVINWINRR